MSVSDNSCFILSAGRTGTVFLTDLLTKSLPKALVVHEPFPARYELVLGNFRNATGFGDAVLRRMFLRSRSERMRQAGYVEINPLLCPITDLLLLLPVPLNIIHVVREPISWSQSIAAFRSSAGVRHVIDYIPFAKPYPSSRPKNWSELAEVDRALWRWNFCNERIAGLKPHAQRYALLRYEDLFSDDLALRQSALDSIAGVLPMRWEGKVTAETMMQRKNPRPSDKGQAKPNRALARTLCGDLASQFGYADL